MNHPKQPWQMNPYELRAHHATQVAAITDMIDTTSTAPDLNSSRVSIATAGGDERKLRGIPAIGRGVAGAIPGSSPHTLRH